MIDQNFSIGVLGCGWWGKNIVRTLNVDLRLKNIKCYDPSSQAQDLINKEFKVEVTKEIENILMDENLKAVCIASPPGTHYELTKRALNSGKHVLIEKPPAFNMTQLDDLNSLAKKLNLVYMLDCLYLFSDPIVKLKNIIDNEPKENIKFVHIKRVGDELRRDNAGIGRINNTMFNNGVDILDDLFFHDAGILFHLFDSEFHIESVQKLHLFHKKLADTVFISINSEFPVKVDLSWTLTPRERSITIIYSNKIVEYNAFSGYNELNIHWLESMKKEKIKYQNNKPLSDMLIHFLKVIKTEKRKNYIGNYELMRKILNLKLLV